MAFQGYRTNDAVIVITQDNARRAIEVQEMNHVAEEALGYSGAEMKGHPLTELMPGRIRDLLNEYVEYEADGNDAGEVLSKVQSFCLLDSKGKEVGFRLKVLRTEATEGKATFRLILQNTAAARKQEAYRHILRENLMGHEVKEPITGMPDRASIEKDLELMAYYVKKEALQASFAVMDIDGIEEIKSQHGPDAAIAMLRHVAQITRHGLRPDDILGCISEHALGVILMDTTLETARIALNRLRWLVAANALLRPGKDPLPVTVSIAFAPIAEIDAAKHLVEDMEKKISPHPGRSGNALLEGVA